MNSREPLWMNEFTADELIEFVGKTDVAIVVIGTVEAHGVRLPVGCDLFSAIAVAEEVARRREVLLPPPIPVAFLFRTSSPTVSLRVETMRHLLDDYFRSLSEMGVRKIVVLSGCGQPISALSALCKELGEKHRVKVILTRVKMLIRDEVEEFCGESDTHAGCWETSIILAM